MPPQDQILLQTKLHRPRLTKDLITRTRLVELLDHEIDHPLILVCAPAGFGKTTLVGTWLDQMAVGQGEKAISFPSAWLSLDEDDSDLNLFLRYFIAAIRTIFPDACEHTLALQLAGVQPPQAALFATFSNELENLPGEFILVLDDYHTIHGEEVHNLLGELVRHWPKPLHLVLISRVSPPISLDNLRAKGMVSEIRTRDLRFTTEETADYLGKTQFALMSQAALPVLEERFEGWPAGLHLAAISMRSASSQEAVLAELSGEHPNIAGFLVDEVVSQQTPQIQTFLLKTSILDRFCATLCEAVIGDVEPAWNARRCLDWIERSEMFIISLDNRREWYRYHHLFQELLQRRLSAEMASEQINELHLRASAWLEQRGLINEAIHHALAAGDLDLAARQMSAGLREALNREDRPTLERWLRLLPEKMIQRDPGLLMIKAWAFQFMWRLDLQAGVLRQIEELLDSDVSASLPEDDLQILRAQILLIQSQYTYFSNQTSRTIELCREVLALTPSSWTFVRGSAMLYLGFAMQANGQMGTVEKLLRDEYELCIDKTEVYPLILLETLGFIYLLAGQLDEAIQIGQVMIHEATRSGNIFAKLWGDYFIGVACYQSNDLDKAAQHFAQILNNRYLAHIAGYRDAVTGLALIHQIRGEDAEAWQMLESISQYDLEQSGIEDEHTRSLRARLQILQGDLESARAWVHTFTDPPPDMALILLEEPQVTRLRVLLTNNTDADRQQALQTLDILIEIVERTLNTCYKIHFLAMRALLLETQGASLDADAALKQALDLARPGGFIRVFADLGGPMEKMLRRLADQGYGEEMIARILTAFPGGDIKPSSSDATPLLGRQHYHGASVLAETLTPRELEVLSLLRGPLSIKEIALQLNISYATAKRHTVNLYAKLGVDQRWNAVSKAEELSILPPR